MTINVRGMDMDTMEDLLEMPIHPWTGLRAIDVLASGRVVWPVLGGAEDDDTGEGVDDEPETPADDVPDSDDAGDTDTSEVKDKAKDPADDKVSRTELAKVIAARDRAKTELRDRTRELEEMRRASETAEDAARREASDEAQKKADAKYKPISVRAGLLEAGVRTGRVKGALKLLDMDDIDIDEDGEVSGLDSQLVALRSEWPELFADPETDKKPEERRRSPRVDGAEKPPDRKPKTASEMQAARLLGKS